MNLARNASDEFSWESALSASQIPELLTWGCLKMSGFSQEVSRTAKCKGSREPGKQVTDWLSSWQSAAIARVLCSELSGAKVTRSSLSVTCKSAALAKADWMRVRPSSSALGVVRSDGAKKITLRLISHHFKKVGQMFAFRGQLHDRVARQGLEGDPFGQRRALLLPEQHLLHGLVDVLS